MKNCFSFTKTWDCVMKIKTAVIVWVNWQDGRILRDLLKSKKYNIIWISRNEVIYNWIIWSKEQINILDKKKINELIKKYMPDELYYLAAYHHSSEDTMPSDGELFKNSTNVHINWYFNFLESVSKYSSKTKICYASSCLIYWWSDTTIQNEKTLPVPNSIYAMTKLQWMHLGNYFADKYNLQILNAILYNHESEYRSSKFVSMKIIQGAIDISKGLKNSITLWDLSTKVDRWYAYDYVEVMYSLLQWNTSWDYIISSGNTHTIQELVEVVFSYLELDWKKYVKIDKGVVKRTRGILYWNNKKLIKFIWYKKYMWFKHMIVLLIKKLS